MERILAWLNHPLSSEGGIRLWMALGAGLVLLAAILIGAFLGRRARRRHKPPEPVTREPKKQPALELANLQGMGMRAEQQDAFGVGAPNDAYARYFTGQSYLKPLTVPGQCPVFLANVTFEPGCRNN